MIAEINLLPQREKRSIFKLVIATAGIILIIGIYSYLLFQYFSTKDSLAQNEEFLQNVKEVRLEEEAKLLALQESNAAQKLEELVFWLENVPLPTVSLLDSVVMLLPESGYFMEFAYREEGKLNIKAQFETISEVASYLHHLSATPLFAEVWVSKVEAGEYTLTNVVIDPEFMNTLLFTQYVADYDLLIQPEKVAALKGVE